MLSDEDEMITASIDSLNTKDNFIEEIAEHLREATHSRTVLSMRIVIVFLLNSVLLVSFAK